MGRFVGKQADGYETRIGRLLPGYELLHLLSRAQLLARLPERARLLSVGCGAGGELAELAGLRPGWRFVAADLSADMLALARQRCARLGLLERIELHCGDVAGYRLRRLAMRRWSCWCCISCAATRPSGAFSRRSPSVWRQRRRCCWPT